MGRYGWRNAAHSPPSNPAEDADNYVWAASNFARLGDMRAGCLRTLAAAILLVFAAFGCVHSGPKYGADSRVQMPMDLREYAQLETMEKVGIAWAIESREPELRVLLSMEATSASSKCSGVTVILLLARVDDVRCLVRYGRLAGRKWSRAATLDQPSDDSQIECRVASFSAEKVLEFLRRRPAARYSEQGCLGTKLIMKTVAVMARTGRQQPGALRTKARFSRT